MDSPMRVGLANPVALHSLNDWSHKHFRYTAIYLLLFLATLVQYFITSGSSPGYVLDAIRLVNESHAIYEKTITASNKEQSASSKNGRLTITVEANQPGRSVVGTTNGRWNKLVMDMHHPGSSLRWYIFEETALCVWTGILYISYLKANFAREWWKDGIIIILLAALSICLVFLLLLLLFHRQIEAMTDAVMSIPTINSMSDFENIDRGTKIKETRGNKENSTRGRGRGLPMGAFMRDGRNAHVDPTKPTPFSVVGRGKESTLCEIQHERFDLEGEGTRLFNAFESLNIDNENIEKFTDFHDNEGFVDHRELHPSRTTQNETIGGVREVLQVRNQLELPLEGRDITVPVEAGVICE
ncbi:hypothetical protein GIB67_007041 [Kingdonia uniflora]|uniref:Uncharacterized protein n=1 Tax=Kingdonia uniflora TaxID=39325 RepID=A0A7J7P029_9MAGN|nr:hypothetical protein GIB67_007041 [Kingdonia uniflora]